MYYQQRFSTGRQLRVRGANQTLIGTKATIRRRRRRRRQFHRRRRRRRVKKKLTWKQFFECEHFNGGEALFICLEEKKSFCCVSTSCRVFPNRVFHIDGMMEGK